MLPSFHLAVTFIIWFLLQFFGLQARYLFIVMLISGVLIDFDIFFVKPHRISVSHTPFFWIIISLVIYFISPAHGIGILLASQAHLMLDLIDGQIMLVYPINRKMYGLNLIIKRYNLDPEKDSPIVFLRKIIITREIILPEMLVDLTALFIFVYYLHFNLLFVIFN